MGPGDEPWDDGDCMGRLVMLPLQGENLGRLSPSPSGDGALPIPALAYPKYRRAMSRLSFCQTPAAPISTRIMLA